ncbi:DoxX family protein [Gloeothece citriformis PCC 7424]|uniref:DoxX family protein n=1 Tax=Gloeothece citriformis (strain PCC 7424) TaxID=65393 RepID=B7KKL4_GLOC7|nr:DoxX family protein [Gloeothece citriformis]ACK72347.1 DoxX family protein [Gloeothece citriformis PCC 7424]
MEKFTPLLARILLSGIFIRSGFNKLLNPAMTQQYMESKGIPLAGILLVLAIIVLLAGGLSILLGFKARLGAWLLIGFLIPATLIFHTDFSISDEVIAFWKNLGLMGGLLMITAFGAGSLSFDERNRSWSNKASSL